VGNLDTMSAPGFMVSGIGFNPHVKDTTTGKMLVRGFEEFPSTLKIEKSIRKEMAQCNSVSSGQKLLWRTLV